MLSGEDPKGILLGAGLAASLGVEPGDDVILLATSASGAINGVEAHVRGFFMSDVRAYDDTVVRAPIVLARQLLKVSGSHAWVIALDQTERTQPWVKEFRHRFEGSDYELIPWFEMADFYNKSVTLLSSQMLVVRVIIGLIIVLSISNVLIMSVLERIGEIGTQMAMGTRRREILKPFLWEGLLLGLIGALFGVLSGVLLARVISAIGIPMPPPPGRDAGYSGEILLTSHLVIGALALALSTTILASLYPAWKGARLEIVDALRHNR